jgi:hypothetical protein
VETAAAATPLYQTINNSGLSDADIEKILEEEERK